MEHINEMQTKNSRSFNLNIKDLIQGKKRYLTSQKKRFCIKKMGATQ